MKTRCIFFLLLLSMPFKVLVAQENDGKSELDKIHHVTYAKRDSLSLLLQTYSDNWSRTADSSLRDKFARDLAEIAREDSINTIEELKKEFQFIETHLSSSLSLDIMSYKIMKTEGLQYYSTFTSLFNQLSPQIRNSEKGKQLGQTLSNIKNSQAGSVAPEIIALDVNKEQLSLSSFKNKKYVLLDFWASWCIPCRQDFPFLKRLYKQYQSKGFEIISISRDAGTEEWIKAIEHDGIGAWKHCSTKDNGYAIPDSYFVQALPTKVLIDNQGRIIARWRGGGEANKAELEKLLIDIFENDSVGGL